MQSNIFLGKKPNSGSALIEVLVAIVLGSLLIGLVLHADLAVNRRILRWSAQMQLEQTAVTVSSRMRSDMAWADSVVRADSAMLILSGERRQVQYSFRDGRIERNGESLLKDAGGSQAIRVSCSVGRNDSAELERDFTRHTGELVTLTFTLLGHAAQSTTIPLRPLGSIQIE